MTAEDRIREADEAFFEIFQQFRLYPFVNPSNHLSEKERFFDACDRKRRYEPRFEYNPLPGPVGRWKRRLDALQFGDSALEKTYNNTRIELINTIDLAEKRGGASVTEASIRLFRAPGSELMEEALEELRVGGEAETAGSEIGVRGVAEELRGRLRSARIEGWDVVEDPSCVTLAQVDWADHKIRLQSGIIVAEEMVARLVHHLIEVHVFRALNGERQPLKAFAVGLDQFHETEEGLAVTIESRAGVLVPSTARRYAGRAIASYEASRRSFFDIFSRLVEFFPTEEAYTLTARSKRGLSDTSKPGGFIHDHIFLSGKKLVEKLSITDLRMLFIGKISVRHIPLVQELLKRNQLIEPAFLPESLNG